MDVISHVRSVMRPLTPLPTGVEPRLAPLPETRVVIFDIYGTLLISAAGDVRNEDSTTGIVAMERALHEMGHDLAPSEAAEWVAAFDRSIREQRERDQQNGIPHPEVEIREIWSEFLAEKELDWNASRVEELALRFECHSNPCWEMPGAGEVVRKLAGTDLALGVLSNAQFYTEPVLQALAGIDLSGTGFDADLCIYSFEEGAGKPSPRLFEKIRDAAGERGIAPEEVFYVGNDLVKDVLPARHVGFRTGLFAGDLRSLRCGDLPVEEAVEKADVVLTDLHQLGEVVGSRHENV